MDARLLDVLVCPLCKGQLVYQKASQELICYGDKLAYQIRDDIPIMWADQARTLTTEEIDARPKG
ncbi:Trm112 family protein [Undibacterium sp. Di27W]|uniref:Trm112 family protein n=1 Tax=Undibacterium sp. Di27W TaxID=3413036 RepID=UPI003BF19FE3